MGNLVIFLTFSAKHLLKLPTCVSLQQFSVVMCAEVWGYLSAVAKSLPCRVSGNSNSLVSFPWHTVRSDSCRITSLVSWWRPGWVRPYCVETERTHTKKIRRRDECSSPESLYLFVCWHRVPVGVISTVKSRELFSRESERCSEKSRKSRINKWRPELRHARMRKHWKWPVGDDVNRCVIWSVSRSDFHRK